MATPVTHRNFRNATCLLVTACSVALLVPGATASSDVVSFHADSYAQPSVRGVCVDNDGGSSITRDGLDPVFEPDGPHLLQACRGPHAGVFGGATAVDALGILSLRLRGNASLDGDLHATAGGPSFGVEGQTMPAHSPPCGWVEVDAAGHPIAAGPPCPPGNQ